MPKSPRWVVIVAALCIACAAQAAATNARLHHPRERSAHATYRTTRYARQTSPRTSHPSHTSKAKPRHYVHHRYARRRRYYHHRVRLPKAPSPERITQIQSALARGGYYQGDPTGKWDADTVAAVQKFQSANNIDATGKLDAPTLQKLGLGSDIAGVAAPKPVVPKLCCSTSAPGSATPSAAPPLTSVPGKPAASASAKPASPASPAPAVVPAQPVSTASHNSVNPVPAGATGASSAAAVAPAANSSDTGASDPTSPSKPTTDRH